MTNITLVGVDPGLVHTGVSCLTLYPKNNMYEVETFALDSNEGPVHVAVENIIDHLSRYKGNEPYIVVEKWRERGTITNEGQAMRKLESELRSVLPKDTVFLENMGAKRLVSNKLLDLFGLYKVQATHHQDIQAAARIMLLGAIKNDLFNGTIYRFVTDALDGNPWTSVKVGQGVLG